MILSDSQYKVLILWFARDLLPKETWDREWSQDFRKRGRVDGNRVAGRQRTLDSLLKVGALQAPLRRNSIYPDKNRATLTPEGLAALKKIPSRVAKRLSPVLQRIAPGAVQFETKEVS